MGRTTTIGTIGDSDTEIDIHELRKRIEPILRDPHSLIHFPKRTMKRRRMKMAMGTRTRTWTQRGRQRGRRSAVSV